MVGAGRPRSGRRRQAGVVLAVVVLVSSACGTADRSLGPGDTAPEASTATTSPGEVLVSCDDASAFPVTALKGPTGAEAGSDPLAVAFRAVLAKPELSAQDLAGYRDWRLVYRSDTRAGFLAMGAGTSLGHMYVALERDDGTWSYVSSGGCDPRVFEPGSSTARWALDPNSPTPGPTTTSLHLLVADIECNDGKGLAPERIHPAQVTYTTTTVVIAYFVVPLPPGMRACPGPPGTPVVLHLDQPLGNRKILDGSVYPPVAASTSLFP